MAFGVTTLSLIFFSLIYLKFVSIVVGDNADTFEETLDST